jgi:peptidyl-Lys metalloendopeptidase
VTNASTRPVWILRWYTPLEGIRGDVFGVTRNGRAVEYEGPLMKRGDPGREEYAEVPARGSISETVDLAGGWDVSRPGRYRVAFTRGIADVAVSAAEIPRARDRHRPVKLSCEAARFEITPK